MTIIGSATEIHKGIEYSRVEGMSLRLDASIPDGDGPFPAAIIVHGGGWVRGDRRIDVAPLFKPLSEAGIAWFSISYRLASDPLHFGVAIDDVTAAIRFVKDHAAEYRIDPDRMALIGESAGGQLAGMAASTSAVRAVVLLYAPTDLVVAAQQFRTDSTVDPGHIQRYASRRFADDPPRAIVADLQSASRHASVPVDPRHLRSNSALRTIPRHVQKDGVGRRNL